MPNVTVTLDEAEQVRLEEILVDGDREGALDFLQRVIKRKLNQRLLQTCRPVFEGPTGGAP